MVRPAWWHLAFPQVNEDNHDQQFIDETTALQDFQVATPNGVGDRDYPLREEFVQELEEAAQVKRRSMAWREKAGPMICGPRLDTIAAPRLCGELFGPSYCRCRFSNVEQDVFLTHMKMLAVLGKHARPQKSLPVYLLTAGAVELVLLSIFVLLQDPAAHAFAELAVVGGGATLPGSKLRICHAADQHGPLHILADTEVAKKMTASRCPTSVRQVLYECEVGEAAAAAGAGRRPLVLQVQDVRDISGHQLVLSY